ncbi:TatD family deoxyribonuclease [Roseospira marina]|uniref:TatD family deoxyribonuclease n=1 Tax=Roseospira marina TaxID=140057 RepID=A0A5M6IGH1_9PROT|nr:TatD family hydrolase [Roseospira marina]KAA5607252.1 TatD family deoxyribonuclease [Roseospira marina]MBB4312596.1 TatD DNase family protein [Roseospira marina]MBB5085388.1 TatD DNase family protein [Roseospira marina]
MLVDSHCHLDFPDLAEDLDEVVARAHRAGIGHMVTICTHVTRFERVLATARRFDTVDCTVGIHPHEAGTEPETSAETLVAMADDPKVIGFGETGLDFFYEHSPRAAQERSFREHIRAARVADLPVVVHTREADDDTVRILQDEARAGAFPGLIHCFSSGLDLAEKALELGFMISISGIVTFKKAEALRETVRAVPLDRLLVETDAPYLAPVPKRGKRNEPAFTALTAAVVAEVKGVTPDELATATTDNFYRLFTKARRPAAAAAAE